MMQKIIIFLVLAIAFAAGTDWQVDSGFGVGTGIATVPSQWAVLRFFPDNITIVAGDTVTWTHRSDGHVIVFYQSVLPVFSDPINIYIDPTFLPTPPGQGGNISTAVNVSSQSVKYSSGIMGQVGQTWTARFDVVGTFFYFCLLHPGQVGYVNVLAAGSTAPKNQSTINNERQAAYAVLNQTAATLSTTIKTTAVRTPRQDGTSIITIDNGYGNREQGFSLNTFGPSETWANPGDTINLVIKDFAGGHSVAFNATPTTSSTLDTIGDYYWEDIIPQVDGSLKGPFSYFRSFGNNDAWDGSVFISGGILLPPGTPGGVDTWNVTISPTIATVHKLPKRFRYICNLHTLNPNLLPPGAPRSYNGQVGYITIYPKGQSPAPGTTAPGTTAPGTTAPSGSSSAAAILISIAALVVATLALMF